MGEAIKVTDVDVSDVKWMWPLVEGYLYDALDRSLGEYDIVDVFNGLMDETMRLWISYDAMEDIKAVAVTMINAYPRRTIANILLLAGKDMSSWQEQIGCIEDWAKQNGADTLIAHTRPGIVKEMKSHGFRNTHQVICKVLARPSHLH